MKKSTLLLPAAGVAAALVLSACASGTSDKAMSGSDSGSTPWCVALESGSASGWPATD